MPLTWKNVDAPSLGTAGALTQGAADSWQAAMNNLSGMFADTREKRQEKASAAALMGAAGITDVSQLQEYLKTVDPTKLNSTAAEALARRTGEVIDYQGALQNQGQRQYENDRTVQTNQQMDAFRNVQMQAAEMAQNGDREGSEKLLADFVAANPLIGEAAMTARSGLGAEYNSYVSAQSDQLMGSLIRDNNSRQDAIAQVREMDLPDDVKNALFAKIEGVSEDRFTAIDTSKGELDLREITMPGSNKDVQTALMDASTDAQVNRTAIDTQLNNNPWNQNQKYIKQFEGEVDYRQVLSDTLGVEQDGWFRSNVDVELRRIQEAVSRQSNGRITITPEQAAAAVMQTYDNGLMPGFRGDRITNVDNAANLAAQLYDPAQQQHLVRESQHFQNMQNQLDALERRISERTQEIQRFQNGGNAERAARAQEALIQDLQRYEQQNQLVKGALMGAAEENAVSDAPGAVVGQGRAGSVKPVTASEISFGSTAPQFNPWARQ